MSTAFINGQSIYYEDKGGTAATLAFSHGILMDLEMFAPQVEALRSRYRCVVWDERGHGRTAGERLAPFSYYDSADDLAALLRHLAIDKAVLVGMSQGGFLSLRCALNCDQSSADSVLKLDFCIPLPPRTPSLFNLRKITMEARPETFL